MLKLVFFSDHDGAAGSHGRRTEQALAACATAALGAGRCGGGATSHGWHSEQGVMVAAQRVMSGGGTWSRKPVRDGTWSGEASCTGSCGRCRWRGDGAGKRSEAAAGGLEEGERKRKNELGFKWTQRFARILSSRRCES